MVERSSLEKVLDIARKFPSLKVELWIDDQKRVADVPKVFWDLNNRLNRLVLPVFFDESFAGMGFEWNGDCVESIEMGVDPWLVNLTVKLIKMRIYQYLKEIWQDDPLELGRMVFENWVDVPVRHGKE